MCRRRRPIDVFPADHGSRAHPPARLAETRPSPPSRSGQFEPSHRGQFKSTCQSGPSLVNPLLARSTPDAKEPDRNRSAGLQPVGTCPNGADHQAATQSSTDQTPWCWSIPRAGSCPGRFVRVTCSADGVLMPQSTDPSGCNMVPFGSSMFRDIEQGGDHADLVSVDSAEDHHDVFSDELRRALGWRTRRLPEGLTGVRGFIS